MTTIRISELTKTRLNLRLNAGDESQSMNSVISQLLDQTDPKTDLTPIQSIPEPTKERIKPQERVIHIPTPYKSSFWDRLFGGD